MGDYCNYHVWFDKPENIHWILFSRTRPTEYSTSSGDILYIDVDKPIRYEVRLPVAPECWNPDPTISFDTKVFITEALTPGVCSPTNSKPAVWSKLSLENIGPLDCELYIPCKDLARSLDLRDSSEDPR